MLGRHVSGLERRSLVRVNRAHVDDDTAAIVLVHVLERRLGGQEGAVHVNRLHLLPVGKRVVFDRVDNLDARVGNENVDRPQLCRDLVYALIDCVFIGNVHGDADRLAAALRDFFGHGVGALLVQVGDGHSRSGGREGQRNLLADAARGAGDHRDLAIQICVQ